LSGTLNDNCVKTTSSKGVYVGAGLNPIPANLASRIQQGDYIDMGELLLESWPMSEETSKGASHRQSRAVTNIFTWLQCFAAYVSVQGSKSPELFPELMAYMTTILRVSQDWDGFTMMQLSDAW